MFKKSWCEKYLDVYKNRWDVKTVNCKQSMLNQLSTKLGDCNAETFFSYIDSNLASYSRVTYISLAADYYSWLIETNRKSGVNAIKALRKCKANNYKNAYQRKITGIRFEECEEKIHGIQDAKVKEICFDLLRSGLRVSELFSVNGNVVEGKFGLKRPFLGSVTCQVGEIHPNTIRNHLAKVGLKPHDLRKAFVTKLIDAGLNLPDVASAVGHKSFKTTALYFQPKKDQVLRDLVKGALS